VDYPKMQLFLTIALVALVTAQVLVWLDSAGLF
jgi:hypothetical protein